MKKLLFSFVLLFCICAKAQKKLPSFSTVLGKKYDKDWLVYACPIKAAAFIDGNEKSIVLYNGLLKRTFSLQPNITCTDYTNLTTGQQLIRAVQPEAIVTIDGKCYNIGGLYGQQEKAYLLSSAINRMSARDTDFHFVSYTVGEIEPHLNWKPEGWAMNTKLPTGKILSFIYHSSLPSLKSIEVTVHYELYDGIPLLTKWVTIINRSFRNVSIGKLVNEQLGIVEEESAVVGSVEAMEKQHGIYIESNYAFNNSMRYDISDQTTHWKADSTYTSQVNYDYQTPCLLEVYPDKVTAVELSSGDTFSSVRTCELLMDSYDRERRGLSIRRMYSTIAPWTTENPIFMHLISKNDDEVRTAVDQCASTGYEALILSFGSHCDMEDTSAANLQKWKALSNYAHSKGIRIGSYSLFSSRRIDDENDVIDPKTGKPDAAAFFGYAPCLGSRWGLGYMQKLKTFLSHTGFDMFENDGPYPGDVCASTKHPGHAGLGDSQWKQMNLQKDLYHWCNERGIYVNAPDWYFLDGTNKIALGYREVNFSLPRANQKILNRQNIYDGLWEKTPSMSWGFVPLTKYQGGTEEAVLEPLSEHKNDYEQLMMQYYGAGVQACYRGPRLYDTEDTKKLVSSVVSWYKKYRDILNSDIIHLRRADGRDWDGIMHVNPQLKTKALAMLYNPLQTRIKRTIQLHLYYSGITDTAKISIRGETPKTYLLKRDYSVDITVDIEPESYTWLTIE